MIHMVEAFALMVGAAMLALLLDRAWNYLVDVVAERRARRRPPSDTPIFDQVREEWFGLSEPEPDATEESLPDAAADPEAEPVPAGWTPEPKFCATTHRVHRIGCPLVRRAEPIKAWTPDAARKWAEGAGLEGCGRCRPFDSVMGGITTEEAHEAAETMTSPIAEYGSPAGSDRFA